MKRKFMVVASFLLIALYAGCYMKTEHKITAHITIDIRQIKEAASSIEDMVAGTPAPAEQSAGKKPNSSFLSLVRDAYAQGAQLKYMTEEISRAIERRKSRYSQIEKLLNEGAVGEDNQGLLRVRQKSSELSDKELDGIVSQENSDRALIHRSIVEQNNLPPEAIKDVQAAFAKERQERVSPGASIQRQDGEWVKK